MEVYLLMLAAWNVVLTIAIYRTKRWAAKEMEHDNSWNRSLIDTTREWHWEVRRDVDALMEELGYSWARQKAKILLKADHKSP